MTIADKVNYKNIIELNNVTLQDCIDLFEKKNRRTIINDGKIIDFVVENENYNQKTLKIGLF